MAKKPVTMTEAQELSETLPKKKETIVSAIAGCIGSIGKIAKASLNQHQRYKFTSIDDFLAATGPACSEHGLIIIQDEKRREIVFSENTDRNNNKIAWLEFEFSFLIIHVAGEELGPFTRTVSVPFHGAQSYGSGQSYALKQFMRSLFQIATGDTDDADYGPQGSAPVIQAKPPKESPPPVEDGTTTESPPVEEELVDLLYELCDLMQAFPNRLVFDSWILETANQPIRAMTKDRAWKMFCWLRTNPETEKWPKSHRLALVNAIAGTTRLETEGNDDG